MRNPATAGCRRFHSTHSKDHGVPQAAAADRPGSHSMKKFKIILWILIFGFIGVIIFQNPDVFFQQHGIHLRLLVIDELTMPVLPIAVYFLAVFLCGLLIAYFFSLPERFRSKKTIKKLNERIIAYVDEISELKQHAPVSASKQLPTASTENN
jgi:uncharacterized integral membrane protein